MAATAWALAAQGATLALLARRADRLEGLVAELGGDASVHAVGLADTHAALEPLVAAASGSRGVADLVKVSSDAGRRVLPVGAVYSATKHAVGAFSESLRQELAPVHVRVGVVEPGITRAELPDEGAGDHPDLDALGDLAVLEAGDIADAVVWMVTRPAHVAVNEMLVRPAEQT